ncbi:pitrilysin family protein [Chitinimonas viridis]|uniref:Pitrilysin family protein n=1 Tax=Chitinimonas viridis TaxID=664880 RepID=A0ABT8B8I7_9NEIS|nr:pitrilysin family protein [Chitinimonas viridis]MDN3578090.1 pitrilysin family protein [Chitinimonas viridis]
MRFTPLSLALALSLGFALPTAAADAPAAPPAGTPAAQAPAAAPTKLSSVEGITEYRLANGLRVLLAPDASKPTTTVNITYLVGSRHENYGETGMAHLLEHLVFKGTPSLPGKSIVENFAKRGMRYNGTTWYDRTNYYETFAASEDNLDWALRMEADRMVNSFIARSDLESEFSVVRNEMESGENNPTRILMQQMAASAYQWHNYGKSTIGARTDVENVKIENLQAFYRNYYQPDNATLTVTGKFDEAKTLAKIAQHFGSIPKPARKLQDTYTLDPQQDGARELTITRVGDTQIVAALYHMAPGAHPDAAAMSLLAQIMGDTPTGRLHKALVEKKKAAGVWAYPFSLKEPGYTLFVADLNKTQSREEARKIILAELENVAKQPITEAELKRAKTALLNGYEKAMSDPVAFGVALSEEIAKGDWRLFFLQRDQIEAATVADVQRVAENYLRESNRTLGQFVPTDKPQRAAIPGAPDVQKLVEGYKGKAAMAEGESFDPSPANIESRTTRLTLGNGMQVALLPKKTRGNTVNGSITLRMGDEKSLFGQSTNAELAGAMLQRGAGKLSRQELADKLEELKAKLSVSANATQVRVGFETRRDKLPELLAVIRDVLRSPTFPAAEFESLRTESITGLEEQMRQPEAVAQKAVEKHGNNYPKGDVRASMSFDEAIASYKTAKLADAKAFYSRFYGAQNGQLALVGDFDKAEAEAQLKQLFGDWKAKAAYQRVEMPFVVTKPAALTLETPDKANAAYIASLPLKLADTSPDLQALQLATRVLGGGALKNRLMDRLRQKEGISYGAGSWLSVPSLDDDASLGMYAIYAPQNLDKLKNGVAEEIAKLVKEGVTEQELSDAKSGLLQEATMGRTQDARLAGALVGQLYLKRTMAFTADAEAKLKATTLEQVNAAIKRYVDPEKLVQAWAGDFANAAKKAAEAKKAEEQKKTASAQ